MLITELEQNKEKCLKLEFNNNSLDQEMKRTLRLFDEYRGKKQDI